MRFILEPKKIEQFHELRIDYEAKNHVDLENDSTLFGLPTLFGGTDIKNRRKQISFLEKINFILQPYLFKEKEIETVEQWQCNLMASKILITACLYVQEEISSPKENSTLYCLLNQYLGITSENFLDEEDQATCIETTALVIKHASARSQLNSRLKKNGKTIFSTDEWTAFFNFVIEKETKRVSPKTLPNYFPVTTLVEPLFATAFTYVGTSIGWIAAETVSHSSAIIEPRLKLTSAIGGAMLILGPSSSTGMAILAPALAAKFISTFCTISFASLSGKAMGLVGHGVGKVAGLPFDVAYNMLRTTGSLLINHYSQPPSLPQINGIRLTDGVIVSEGFPIQIHITKQTLKLQTTPNIQLLEHGTPIAKMDAIIKELNDKTEESTILFEETNSI